MNPLAMQQNPSALSQINIPQSSGIGDGPIAGTMAQQGATSGGGSPQQGNGGNWFTHLLPTAGGILGGIAGLPLNALDAVSGVGGTALNIGLAGAGSAAGKALENKLEGKGLGNGVALAGGEGAIGQGVGGLIGKGIGGVAGLVGNAGKNMAADQVAKTGAEDLISNTANAYKDVKPALQSLYNAKDSIAHVNNMGFDGTNPANLVHVANTTNDALNGVLNSSLADSGPVNLSHYTDLIKNQLAKVDPNGNLLGSYDPVALARGKIGASNSPAAKLLSQLNDMGAGVAKQNSDPEALRKLTTNLYNAAQDAKPTVTAATGAIDPAQRAAYSVINGLRNDVKSALYDRPVVNEALQKAVGNLTPEDVGGSQALADHINGIISQAGNGTESGAQHILSNISKNIDINNLGKEGQKVGQIVTSTGGQARAATAAGLDELPNGNPLEDITGHALNGGGVLGTAVKTVQHAAQNPAILNTLSRMGALTAKIAPAAGVVAATSPNLAADPLTNGASVTPGGTMGSTINGANDGTAMQPQQNPEQQLIDAMRTQAILAPGLAGQSGATSFMQSLAPMLQKNQMLSSEMAGLPSMYANAGGAQGTGGILSQLWAKINPASAAGQYDAQRQAQANQLAQALGITPQAAEGLLPQIMGNSATSGTQQGILGSMSGQLLR